MRGRFFFQWGEGFFSSGDGFFFNGGKVFLYMRGDDEDDEITKNFTWNHHESRIPMDSI